MQKPCHCQAKLSHHVSRYSSTKWKDKIQISQSKVKRLDAESSHAPHICHTHTHNPHETRMYSRTPHSRIMHVAPRISRIHMSAHVTQRTHMRQTALRQWHKLLTHMLRPLEQTLTKPPIFLHFSEEQKS